ncbi:hypothetical protein LINPERHAP1_LOCUS4253 [Linum perenne]
MSPRTPSLSPISWTLSMCLASFGRFSRSIRSGAATDYSPSRFLLSRLQSSSTGCSLVARLATQWLTVLRSGGS